MVTGHPSLLGELFTRFQEIISQIDDHAENM